VEAGALTFLFTDIEASTRRWETDATAMSAALAGHDETLRAAVAAAGGSVFKHTGDGMCAVFNSAAAALAGAIAAQQQLAAGPLRVRMAIHSGEVEARDDDYFGPTLNRAARLMAAAWGGQTLVSAAAAELAGDGLPPGATLVDLGLHRLADLTREERIFQLNAERLESAFPPLRAFSVRRGNLPVSLTTFVGRERELGELADLVLRARLVTLAGVGGAGKTRLAVEVAARVADNFPDGAFLVELAPVTDPRLVAATVAAALGLILDQPGPLPDQLAGYLQRRRALVVLDNCEHVVDAAAALCETVLSRAPEVAIVATSREPLGVPGETVWRIPPLGVADAIDLVRDRAHAARPGFRLSDTDMPALERICTRLDGIPLALELAAARLHVLSPAEVAARLDDRFRLLTGGVRTAVDRHRTLRAAIDWGYDLLDEPSRVLLRGLSVFAGGFDLAAAEAVGGSDVLDLLSGLVDRSWVAIDPPSGDTTRYRLIESIRQYAAEKLAEAGEAAGARRAHCEHFVQLAEGRNDLLGFTSAWLRLVRMEEDNFRAALEWSSAQLDQEACAELASALISYLAFNGRGAEGCAWLERALAIDPGDTGERTIMALWRLGSFLPLAGDSAKGERVLRRAVELAAATGAGQLAALTSATLARQLASRNPEEAVAVISAQYVPEGSLTALEEFSSRHGRYSGWDLFIAINRGWAWLAVGEVEAAERCFRQGLERAEEGSEEGSVAVAHAAAALAPLSAARGDSERASALADQAVENARRVELPIVLVMALTRAAEASIILGRPAEAAHCLAESTRILRDVGTLAWVGDSLKLAAVVAAHDGAYAETARLLGAADAIDALTGDTQRPPAPGADLALARALRALGDERFAAARAAGATLGTDQALAEAIAVLGTLGERSR